MARINPTMVMLARDSRAFTQAALAEALRVSQGTLSKLENEQFIPSDDLLKRLSEVLDYPVEFFSEEEPFKSLPISFYRKRIAVSTKRLKAITAKVNIIRMVVRKLLRSAEIPHLRFTTMDADEVHGNVEQAAREIRIRWNMPPGPINNVTKILENAGILVMDCDFETNKIDGLSIYDPEDCLPPIIILNPSMPGDRYRFTLCHEFAHIIFHHHLPALAKSDVEDEANRFASELLIPTKDIKAYLYRLNLRKLASLKPHWKTSMQAILYKASSIGVISDRQKRHLFMEMSKRGYKSVEPFPIPREEPTLLKELIRFHLDSLTYSEPQMANALRVNEHEFRSQYLGIKTPNLRIIKNDF